MFIFSKTIVLTLFGPSYASSTILLQIMSIIPLAVSLSTIFGIETMLTFNYKKAIIPETSSENDIIPETHDDDEITTISTEKPKIRKIRENNRPYIRKVKESTEKISFNTNRKASNWKEKLNNINKTPSNNERRPAPKPRRRQ